LLQLSSTVPDQLTGRRRRRQRRLEAVVSRIELAGRAAGCARVAILHDEPGDAAVEADLAALLRYLEITFASPHG
jgi:hypothetical protein